MNEKELAILSHLRKDARKSLVDVANEADIPISTVYDKVRKYEKGIIKKHTCILDFQKIGYNIRVMMLMKIRDEKNFREIAKSHRNVNSVFKLSDQGKYLADCIFRYMTEMEDFLTSLSECGVEENDMHFISEEVVRENFLVDLEDEQPSRGGK